MHPGLIAAGLTNILGVLIFSRGFSNSLLNQLFPALFGNWGLICIMLWGLAYLSAARSYRQVPALLGVFAVEKGVYVVSWLCWLVHCGANLPQIWQQDVLTALFYLLYGILDLIFGVFFLNLMLKVRRSER